MDKQVILTILLMLPYIGIVVLDFMYKEMYYWQVLASIVINFIGLAIYSWFYGCNCVTLSMPIVLILFALCSAANLKWNKETKIGCADIDLFSSQAILLLQGIFVIIRNEKMPETQSLMITTNLLDFVGSLGIGFAIMIGITVMKIIIYNIRRKKLKDWKKVPSLFAFLPVIYTNIQILSSFNYK